MTVLIKNKRIFYLSLVRSLQKAGEKHLNRGHRENSHFYFSFGGVLWGSGVLRAYRGCCDITDLLGNNNWIEIRVEIAAKSSVQKYIICFLLRWIASVILTYWTLCLRAEYVWGTFKTLISLMWMWVHQLQWSCSWFILAALRTESGLKSPN